MKLKIRELPEDARHTSDGKAVQCDVCQQGGDLVVRLATFELSLWPVAMNSSSCIIS